MVATPDQVSGQKTGLNMAQKQKSWSGLPPTKHEILVSSFCLQRNGMDERSIPVCVAGANSEIDSRGKIATWAVDQARGRSIR